MLDEAIEYLKQLQLQVQVGVLFLFLFFLLSFFPDFVLYGYGPKNLITFSLFFDMDSSLFICTRSFLLVTNYK